VIRRLFIYTSLLAVFCSPALAETVYLQASQDNTLYDSPTGRLSNGSGEHLFSGMTLELERRRAVIAFKDLGVIPDEATITSARLHLNLSKENSGPSPINLYRLTRDWGEGSSNAAENEGRGANSETGDATWAHTFWPNRVWLETGGDFVQTSSAEQIVILPGAYTFGSTAEMTADVQLWLDQPSQNFGWILTGDETRRSTAKRFDSRENENEAWRPVLEVVFSTTGSSFDFSGPWFDPSLDGEGYLVYQTPAGWLIYFFGYSADGNFRWLISNLVTLDLLIAGEPFELDMSVGKPGTFEAPTPGNELLPYGTLSVRFDTCTTGQFILDGLDGLKTSNVIKAIGVDGTSCG